VCVELPAAVVVDCTLGVISTHERLITWVHAILRAMEMNVSHRFKLSRSGETMKRCETFTAIAARILFTTR
jgi:hypothetical protein